MIQCSRIAFGFVGIYDQDEAERIIEGQSTVIDMSDSTDQAPSVEATKMAPRLIDRAQKAGGAFQAALDYAGENFSGFNLLFVNEEINKAKSLYEATLINLPQKKDPVNTQAASVPNPKENPPKENSSEGKAPEQADRKSVV